MRMRRLYRSSFHIVVLAIPCRQQVPVCGGYSWKLSQRANEAAAMRNIKTVAATSLEHSGTPSTNILIVALLHRNLRQIKLLTAAQIPITNNEMKRMISSSRAK